MTETITMMTDKELSNVIGMSMAIGMLPFTRGMKSDDVYEALASTIDQLKDALNAAEASDDKLVSKDTETSAEEEPGDEAAEDSDDGSDDDIFRLFEDDYMASANFLGITLDKDTFRIEKLDQIPQELMDPDTELDFVFIPELNLYMHYDRNHVLKFSDVRYYTGKLFFYDDDECNYSLKLEDYMKLIYWIENHITLSTFDSCNWFPVLKIEKGKGWDELGDCDEFDFAV